MKVPCLGYPGHRCPELVEKPATHCANCKLHVRTGSTSKWRRLRAKVLAAAGHRCEHCGRTQAEAFMATQMPLEVHHRNGDAQDDRLENLQALCHDCHQGKHRSHRTHRTRTHAA